MTGLGLALEGSGWHPAAWREPDAQPHRVDDTHYWAEIVRTAEGAGLDLVTFEESSAPREGAGGRVEPVTARLDAVLTASRVGPMTRHIGLLPTASTAHPEPFHVSTAIATLDHATLGRAGWLARVTSSVPAWIGRHPAGTSEADLLRAATDAVEVSRRLWGSWEDDAIVHEVTGGRFGDRNRLHQIDFDGEFFSVHGGPPVVPCSPHSPQGQPPVAVLGHGPAYYELAARSADLLLVTPAGDADVGWILREVRRAHRPPGMAPLRVWADLTVVLDDDPGAARDRADRLDADGQRYTGDALLVVDGVAGLADLIERWAELGLDGFRLRPAAVPHDVLTVAQALVPELRRRGLRPDGYESSTLRGLLGLDPSTASGPA